MANRNPSFKNLLMYTGIMLVLTGTIAAKGEDMIIILLGGISILLLEAVEFKQLPYMNAVLVQLTISGALLLVGIIKIIESVGKSFTAHHLYLTMILIGLIFILIEGVRRYPTSTNPEG